MRYQHVLLNRSYTAISLVNVIVVVATPVRALKSFFCGCILNTLHNGIERTIVDTGTVRSTINFTIYRVQTLPTGFNASYIHV